MSASELFFRFSHHIARLTGRPLTFVLACIMILVWAVTGPAFGFSATWQLVINTTTTIVTFLMVFVLQNSQNRDGEALQAKLDELIFALKDADNRFVGAEKLSDRELRDLHQKLMAHVEKATAELGRREARRRPEAAATD